MKMQKLQHLTPKKIIDVIYNCGSDTPVFAYLPWETSSGKTYLLEGLYMAMPQSVNYIGTMITPHEHRKRIAQKAATTELFIHDDVGLCSRYNLEEYWSTLVMLTNGTIDFSQYKTKLNANIHCSCIITSTLDQYYLYVDSMTPSGMLDRFMCMPLKLSDETKRKYCKSITLNDSIPANLPLNLEKKKHEPLKNILDEMNVQPRLYKNILRISQYLTVDECIEWIKICMNYDAIYQI